VIEPAQRCQICGAAASARTVSVRSGSAMTLWHCQRCVFDFFAHDPSDSLAADGLDSTRLQAAGMEIPERTVDFENGTQQAVSYVREYLDESDRAHNILEVGCSWGYFLAQAARAGAIPYGIELNSVRATYVNRDLGFACDETLEACAERRIRFKKIFLFYVLEHIPQPLQYLQRLLNLLEEGGQLVGITPNLQDPLKDIWRNVGFAKFFYDKHSINYFSPLAVRRMIERLPAGPSSVSTRQGYSVANHIGWFLTNAPRTTGVVGGDNYIRDIVRQLELASESAAEGISNTQNSEHAARLAALVRDFDASYRSYLESQDFGNQIRFTIVKQNPAAGA
jgi:2-polyprenyl-3-methyl-5-hydroxy-6-metoxy-1,4-benzoquinol methylase